MKNIILIISVFLVQLNSIGQNLHSSPADSASTFGYNIPWWSSSNTSDFVSDLDTIDNLQISTEICSNAISDTIFFGNFEFPGFTMVNEPLMYLKITKRKNDFSGNSDIKDSYLAITYNGQVISNNLADILTNWSNTDSTTVYFIDISTLQISLDENILNSPLFGFIFSTTPSSNSCISAFINSVELFILNEDITNMGVDLQTSCSSYTWINGITYSTSNNTATHTIIGGSTDGSDSLVILDFTFNNPSYGTEVVIANCSFTWANGDGNTYTTDNNTATHIITGGSSSGCDSIITLNLTINNVTEYIQKGADIIGESGDQSGNSISMSADGNTLAIGSSRYWGYTGRVKIYQWNSTQWVQKGTDIIGMASNEWLGTSISLSSDGNVIVIGVIGAENHAGQVRVFEWNGNSWGQKGLSINGESADDYSGKSVSISSDGNTVAIGAKSNDDAGNSAGHVRIYIWNGNSWIQRGMDIDGENANDKNGAAVSINSDGNVIAISAPGNDNLALNTGYVRIFAWDGSNWMQKGNNIDGENESDNSGSSISISSDGNTIAIGASANDDTGSNAGHVRVYSWNSNIWIQKGADIDGENTGDQSGCAVAIDSSGNTIVIGAKGNDDNGTGAGHVRVHSWNGNAWIQRGEDLDGQGGNMGSGTSVALSSNGKSIAIGAPKSHYGGGNSGHVRVYNYNIITYPTSPQFACNSFTWIDGNTYTSNNNTATHALTNSAGCDSIITLDLTINSIDNTVTQNGSILTAIENGNSYQWLTCPNMTHINTANNQAYIPIINGSYAVIVTNNTCIDTSICYTIEGLEIIENDFGIEFCVYPNPTDGNFSINLGEDFENVTVIMTDLAGKIIQSNTYKDNQLLNLRIEEPTGIYLLLIKSGNKSALVRLVKN